MDVYGGNFNRGGTHAQATVGERIRRERVTTRASGFATDFLCSCTAELSAAFDGGPESPRFDPFSLLPDELVVQILSRLGGSAADVSIAAMTCRRWRALTTLVPSLTFGATESEQLSSPMRLEESISRMVLRSDSLRHLDIVSPLPSASPACCACGAPASTSQQSGCGPCCVETENDLRGAASACAAGDSASFSHPREFIFEAWMRHAGPSLRSLNLSRSVPAAAASNCGGGSVVVNLWEEEDASLHLAHISRHCTNLSSLSLGHVSLSAPTLLATLQPMPALQHLSLSWLHASSEALHAVLDAVPNLRRLTIFMASGFPRLNLRLPATLEHLSLSYVRADTIMLHSAHSLQSLSIRDMFLRNLSVRQAPNLRQLAVASANSLFVSAPQSSRMASIDFRAGSLNWPATEILISANSAALESLSLDFFALGSGTGGSSVSSLPWLAQNCPKLRILRLGLLAWQKMVHWSVESGLLQSQCNNGSAATLQPAANYSANSFNNGGLCNRNMWPQLEELKVRLGEKGPEGLLLLHAILTNTPSLTCLHVTVEGEEEDEDEEEEEDDVVHMEYEDCDAMSMEEEYEEECEDEEELKHDIRPGAAESHAGVFSDSSSQCPASAAAAEPALTTAASVHLWPALTPAERQQQLFLKGLDCLQRRFGCFHVTSPVLYRRETL